MADPFDVLGIPARFDLSDRDLHRAWLTKSRSLHADAAPPDIRSPVRAPRDLRGAPFAASVAPTEKPDADTLRAAAEVNRARAELADPVRRAEALLARLDPGAAPDKSLPDGFLMELLEAREGLEEATTAKDHAGIRRWHDWASDRGAEYFETTKRLFSEHPANPDALKEIRRTLNAWRSLARMLEQMPDS